MSLIDEIRAAARSGGMVTQLIAINLGVFLIVNLVGVFYFLGGNGGSNMLTSYLAVPASIPMLWTRPWTIFTYMFLHEGFLHILFNILWLYWFGTIFLQYFSSKQLLGLYILGGLFGGLFYIVSFNVFPVFAPHVLRSYALGASASVIAIVAATAVYVPNYVVQLMFIGPVKLKWIAIVMIVLDVIGVSSGNSGGHLAHLGGAFMGWIFINSYRNKTDLTKFIPWIATNLFSKTKTKKKNPHMHVSYKRGETEHEYNARKRENQKQLDSILEKVKKDGYASLSRAEKDILFDSSNKKDL
ncbi:MAG: rhomboid family intramembrane serine protease [Salinivirgaceae bacterium]|nr:rhomboid family intramembrane serine protease [Salinivirgaceae bacterium]MDD4746064.1 rhomboid family intramembrane serine protease [Salinivirgaceae bacterium]